MAAMHYCAAHSWNQSHHLSTSRFAAGPRMKILNTSQNISVTANQFPTQTNSNVLAQPQRRRRQRTILQAQTQPQNSMRMQKGTNKTYLLLKTSLEALKTSTTETPDALKTLARALKLQRRALAPSVLRQHLSCSKVCCRTKCKTGRKTHCR